MADGQTPRRRTRRRERGRILGRISAAGIVLDPDIPGIRGVTKEGFEITPAGRQVGTGAILMSPEAARLAIIEAGEGPLVLNESEIERFERRALDQPPNRRVL